MNLTVTVNRHSYGNALALSDIKLKVGSGEIVCIIGPSGCGKSTLLGIIGGLLRPTDGTVTLSGCAPAGCLNELTYIFQDFSLLPWRTVTGNISLVLEGHKLTDKDRASRIEDVLARTGLSDYGAFYPKQLSGGMRQRVGIARALATNPAILLMDEPFSALDAQTRMLLLDDFLELWSRERLTAVYVTHNLDEALRVADRIVVLSRRPGKVKEEIRIDIPQLERNNSTARAELDRIDQRLWELIKGEALIATEEVTNA